MTQSPDSATPASLAGLRAGADVGGYRLVRRLGAGGMGVVWEAIDGDGRHVAMKILHPQIAADPTARRRLDREASVLARVKDSRVARILDIETGDGADGVGLTFVITELVDGPTLQAEVDHEGVYRLDTDVRDLSDLAHGLVDALAAVHAAGVIHRDLKPSNVMLGAQGPVLIDFGIAQVADDVRLTQTGQVTGTPGFIPPEMLDGGEPSPGVDWYALAGVILFAITGRSPFGSGPWQAVFRRVYAGTPELGDLEETQPALARAFTAALAPDAADRLSVPDLLRVLDEIADGGTGQDALAQVLPDTESEADAEADEADTSTGTYGSVYSSASSAGSPGSGPVPNPGYGLVRPASSSSGAYGFLTTPSPQADGARSASTGATASGAMPSSVSPSGAVSGWNAAAHPPSFVPGSGAAPVRSVSPTPAQTGPAPAQPAAGYAQQGRPVSTSVAVPASNPLPAPAPNPAAVPEWALEPRRHRTVAALFFLMLVAVALPIPGLLAIGFSLLVAVAGTVGRADDARRWRRLRAGYASAADNSRMWASMPWYLLRSLIASGAACVVGGAVGLMVFYFSGQALGFGADATASVMASWSDYHRLGLCLVLVASACMLVTWLVPWGGPARRGGARLIGLALRSPLKRRIACVVFVLVAAVIVVLFATSTLPVGYVYPFTI
ncbi:Serine/threonine protein kinase [Actinomyces ruminicola]|uniref:Serine/threonine protein kinase n=1 Tax=Actinomyces ruminicola TaxID=332524 RepID=A0A1H0F286_9ACTO|nr:serine/threonine-protein kinase [Actinomyces ruminicola]SDN88725.1 Serine/threonine protein kinase [Actinomyces ruminicola]